MTVPPLQNPQNPNPAYANQPAAGFPAAPPAPYGPPVTTVPSGTNGLAIAALVTGILGMNLLAWIFGGIGLSQIKKTGQNGRGMALTGIVLGIVWSVLVVILVAAGVLPLD